MITLHKAIPALQTIRYSSFSPIRVNRIDLSTLEQIFILVYTYKIVE